MLKIQRLPRGNSVVLAVSGRLDGEAIGALRSAVDAEAGGTVVVDLEEMRLVDREGVITLAGYEAAGVRLEHCPEYARQWIDAEIDECARSRTTRSDTCIWRRPDEEGTAAPERAARRPGSKVIDGDDGSGRGA